MAQKRMLNKSISLSSQVNKLNLKEKIIFTWAIPHLDDYGLLDSDPEVIKATVCPMVKEITIKEIKQFVKRANELGLIIDFQDCLEFTGFENHQSISAEKKAKMKFLKIPKNPQENIGENNNPQKSPVQEKIREDKRREEKIRALADANASSLKKSVSELQAEGKIGFGEKCVLGIPMIPPRMSMKKEYRNKGQEFGRLVLWIGNCFAEAYEKRVGEKYLGGSFCVDPIAKQVSKFKNDLALGRTQLKEMLDQYFKSEKAEELTISLNTAFSDDTYLRYKQGKLLGKKKKKIVKYEE